MCERFEVTEAQIQFQTCELISYNTPLIAHKGFAKFLGCFVTLRFESKKRVDRRLCSTSARSLASGSDGPGQPAGGAEAPAARHPQA